MIDRQRQEGRTYRQRRERHTDIDMKEKVDSDWKERIDMGDNLKAL